MKENKGLLVIGAGGTGGHIYAGLSIAQRWKDEGGDVLFVGSSYGMEKKLIRNFPLEVLNISPFKGKGIRGVLILFQIPFSILKVISLFLRKRPSVVLGIGGYASFPVCFSAWIMRIPLAIMEQNTIPGLTNKILSGISSLCFTGFDTSRRYLKAKKIIFSGNPVRKEVKNFPYQMVENRSDYPTIMVLGGSQGARFLNELMPEVFKNLLDYGIRTKVIHQTGKTDMEFVESRYKELGIEAEVFDFNPDIHIFLSRAHLAVCRAGALTIAELSTAGVPAIFIPYPYAAYNHQFTNAKEVESRGGGVCVEQKDATPSRISEIIKELIESKKVFEMARKMKEFSKSDADEVIVAGLRSLIKC